MRVWVALALLSFLPGCGGGTDSEPAGCQIAMYGDSTTVGYSWNGTRYVDLAVNEPAVVEEDIQREFPCISVVDKGVIGTSLDGLLNGDLGYGHDWATELATSRATIVVVNFGINDSHEPGMSAQKFVNELRELVRIARASGKRIVLETSNPVSDPRDALLPELVAAERKLARELDVPLIDQYAYLSGLGWSAYLSDGIHPTAAGYALKGNYAASILEPLAASACDFAGNKAICRA